MIVRAATVRDVNAMVELATLAPGAAVWTREQYAQIVQKPSEYIVLVIEGQQTRLLGFLVAQIIVDEFEIQNIAVEAGSRLLGLGSRLMSKVTEIAAHRKAHSLTLEVRESNMQARKFYEKHGFVPVGTRSRYYCDPQESAVLYRKKLLAAAPENA